MEEDLSVNMSNKSFSILDNEGETIIKISKEKALFIANFILHNINFEIVEDK